MGACLSGLSANAELLTGLTSTGNLVTFDSATPGSILTSVPITGLQAGETLLGIDRRPANGGLYGVGSASRLYQINPVTGAGAQVGSAGAFTLSGTAFGIDFNPVPDRLRVTSTDTTNFRLNPNTGSLAGTDTVLSYAAGDSGAGITPRVVGSAYANNFDGATTTTLYDIDSNRDILTMQGGPGGTPSPNGGALTSIGSGLGFDTSDLVGFDISGVTGTAYAALTPPTGGASQLFTIDLTGGAATLVGTIGTGLTMTGLAASLQTAVPDSSSTFLLLGTCVSGLVASARRFRSERRWACKG